MKKYVEVKKKKTFDWNVALAKDCKDMTEKEVKKMDELAQQWVTCACGNQCAIIPRAEQETDIRKPGSPLDEKLHELGTHFYTEAIEKMAEYNLAFLDYESYDFPELSKAQYLKTANKYRKNAIRILKRIEKRSAQLIQAEITKNKTALEQMGFVVTKKQ